MRTFPRTKYRTSSYSLTVDTVMLLKGIGLQAMCIFAIGCYVQNNYKAVLLH